MYYFSIVFRVKAFEGRRCVIWPLGGEYYAPLVLGGTPRLSIFGDSKMNDLEEFKGDVFDVDDIRLVVCECEVEIELTIGGLVRLCKRDLAGEVGWEN